jgi:hypothetical protein
MKCKSLLFSALCFGTAWSQQGPAGPAANTESFGEGAAARGNFMSYGVSSSSSFNDNALTGSSSQRNFTTAIYPQLGLQYTSARLESDLFFGPGWVYSSDVSMYNSVSQSLRTRTQLRLTKRFSLVVRESFNQTRNPIDLLQNQSTSSVFNLLDRPNPSVAAGNIQARTEQSGLDANYRVSAHTNVAVGGTFEQVNYDQLTGNNFGSSSQRSQAFSTNAYISHDFTPRYSSGIQYQYQNIDSKQSFGVQTAGSRALIHKFLGFENVSLSSGIKISLFAGPELTDVNGQNSGAASPIGFSQWSWAGGASVVITRKSTSLTGSFIREVNDGGTSGGTVQMQSLDIHLRRQLSQRTSIGVLATYVANSGFGAISTLGAANYFNYGATYTKNLTPHLDLSFSYLGQRITGGNSLINGSQNPVLSSFQNQNIGSVALSYNFTRPLGR